MHKLIGFSKDTVCCVHVKEPELNNYESLVKDDDLDRSLENREKTRLKDAKYLAMMDFRKKLPSYKQQTVSTGNINYYAK